MVHMYYKKEVMGSFQDTIKTRSKLINSAGKLFSIKGYSGVTVRDIAKAANVPLGAITYHFKTKANLYKEILLLACKENSFSTEQQLNLLSLSPSNALHTIIDLSIQSYKTNKEDKWKSVIIAKECLEPSEVFDEILNLYFQPQFDFLAKVLENCVGKDIDNSRINFGVHCLIGLVDTFGMYIDFINKVSPGLNHHINRDTFLVDRIYHLVLQSTVDISQT